MKNRKELQGGVFAYLGTGVKVFVEEDKIDLGYYYPEVLNEDGEFISEERIEVHGTNGRITRFYPNTFAAIEFGIKEPGKREVGIPDIRVKNQDD